MKVTVFPSGIHGEVIAPTSKSAMQRACALALLHNGETIIQNPGESNDDSVAVSIIKKLGATFHKEDDQLTVKSTGEIDYCGNLDCGESGLSLRMFASIAALSKEKIILEGTGSLLKRPVHFFDEVFPRLDIDTKTNEGFLPVSIQGPLLPSHISIDGSMSSQYLTGLLFAFAKAAKEPASITVNDLKSKPYIDLSLQLLAHFGYVVKHDDYVTFHIEPVKPVERTITYQVEGDWSGAAFLLVAGAIAGSIRVRGLDLFSMQADRAIIDVLMEAGAAVQVEGSCVLVNNEQELKPFEFDATDCPDLFPPLAVLAVYCKGESVIKGVSRLAGKESDRANSLRDVFSNMGIEIRVEDDFMIIKGGTGLQAATVSSHHDHRIAMACAVAALGSSGDIVISDAEAVNKSYPSFYRHLQMLGAAVSLSDK